MTPAKPLKIKFRKKSSLFYAELKQDVADLLDNEKLRLAKREMLTKFACYSLIYITLYSGIYFPIIQSNLVFLILIYILFGLTGILLAFNCAHDCIHGTFTDNKRINSIVFYLVFNLQGVNSRLWQKRHIASHHIFPNVDGCDADIDDNPFMRLSPHHPLRRHQRYQHLYAPVLYAIYTLHWIFVKDFIYLRKKELANLKNQVYSFGFVSEVILLKMMYLVLLVALPVWLTPLTLSQVLLAFAVMHVVVSLFFVLTLIISHLAMETEFPKVDENGELPYDYYEHQLAVSLDYHPESKWANRIFGGFNSHTSHHLFPNLPHTVYNQITPLIREKARVYNLPYNERSIPAAIRSHFGYLKMLGRA
ncbi:fatty acid desaturase family protein [Flavihumibacter petaseus]|uniref:Putative fatty acid desaturase n=1 Tax=Flavihumibacter petaseus NBRC 106054 TaxID=1220578 RepID=A0A0E9N6B8_9BACT|nr:acyl-CoA desaturase [Flavihumibacter petaseus]GAO45482.1 putative fatty acid desaturase [Flavihumibacter petaseus NBRC 106054]